MTSAGDGHESPHDRRSDEAAGAGGAGGAEAKPAEKEPDPRFTLANERTFLAWSRTALALVAAGLGIVQLLPPFPGVPVGRHLLGIPLIVLGAVIAVVAYVDMMRNQQALRRDKPLPRSALPRLLAGTIGGVAALAAIVVLLSATR
jgi:putative membrane protein